MRLWVSCVLFAVVAAGAIPASAALAPFSLRVDPELRPRQATIAGLDRRGASAVVAVADARGHRVAFIADEIAVQVRDPAHLQSILRRYGGVVERTMPLRGAAPWRLLRIAPRTPDARALSLAMTATGVFGPHRASAPAAGAILGVLAALKREGVPATFNLLLRPAGGGTFMRECCIDEAPMPMGGFLDFAQDPRFSDNQLGIGVVKAWDYLRYKGIPCCNPYVTPTIAIVDSGFALDPNTGTPLPANPDFIGPGAPTGRPQQIDIVDQSSTSAGGPGVNLCGGNTACPWHGTGVFSVAAAQPRNHFGAAGTSGGIAKVILINSRLLSFDVGYAIEGAGQQHPSVINLSFGADCLADVCGALYNALTALKLGVIEALAWEPHASIVAAAMNDALDIEGENDAVPCGFANVICVGAVDVNGMKESISNFGSKISMWAPDGLQTTPNPDSAGQVVPFFGTSSAAPFLAGVIALMKALGPQLDHQQILAILRGTALPSMDPLVKPGFVNAFAAVQAVVANQAPSIAIRAPASGARVAAAGTPFAATVEDPEQDPRIDGVTVSWQSDRQAGPLCAPGPPNIACDSGPLVPGVHHITAIVSDPYGATASASTTVTVGPSGDAAYITWPPNNATYYADQRIVFRGYATIAGDPTSALQYAWSSNLGGNLGAGAPLQRALPPGKNVVTFRATGPHGTTATAVAVNVLPAADVPDVAIVTPADGATLPFGQSATLTATALDPVDGALGGPAVVWSSDVDGTLGNGITLTHALTGGACAPVRHRITVTATNKAKRTGSDTILLEVGGIC